MPGKPVTDGSSSNVPARRAGAMRPSLLAVDLAVAVMLASAAVEADSRIINGDSCILEGVATESYSSKGLPVPLPDALVGYFGDGGNLLSRTEADGAYSFDDPVVCGKGLYQFALASMRSFSQSICAATGPKSTEFSTFRVCPTRPPEGMSGIAHRIRNKHPRSTWNRAMNQRSPTESAESARPPVLRVWSCWSCGSGVPGVFKWRC